MSKTVIVATLVMVESGGVGDCKYQCHQQCPKKHYHQKQQYHNLFNHSHNTTVTITNTAVNTIATITTTTTISTITKHHKHRHNMGQWAFIGAQQQSLAYCNAAIDTHQHLWALIAQKHHTHECSWLFISPHDAYESSWTIMRTHECWTATGKKTLKMISL